MKQEDHLDALNAVLTLARIFHQMFEKFSIKIRMKTGKKLLTVLLIITIATAVLI